MTAPIDPLSRPHTVNYADTARQALERVCSGREIQRVDEVYHHDFVDHVNQTTYYGQEGARRSIARYLELFDDLSFTVEDQVSQADRVASRWTLRGTHRGRPISVHGIVISRFQDGQIIEDWAVADSLDLARQLGAGSLLRLLLSSMRARRRKPRR